MNQGNTPIIDQHGNLREKRVQPSEATGSVYLNEEWMVATLYLFPGKLLVDTLKDVSIRLDIKTNEIDVKAQNKTKVLEGSKVQKFEWVDSKTGQHQTYVNCSKFTFGQTKLLGFCKVSPGKKIQLAKHTSVSLIKADYNVALDVGNKNDRFVQTSEMYFIKDNKMYEASKKNLYTLIPENQADVKKYLKEKDVSFGNEQDLNLLIDYCNSL